MKTIFDIKKEMLLKILNNQDLFKIRESLVELKELNYNAKEVYNLIESLRFYFKECPEEDVLLEILDICCGYCSSHMEVWSINHN